MPIGAALTWDDDHCEVTIISAERTPIWWPEYAAGDGTVGKSGSARRIRRWPRTAGWPRSPGWVTGLAARPRALRPPGLASPGPAATVPGRGWPGSRPRRG